MARFTGRRSAAPLLAVLACSLSLGVAWAQRGGDVPEETILQARLAEKLSTRDARVGQRFEAVLSPKDRSGLPEGTRFEGVITESRRPTDKEPGVLDMEFRRVLLPDQKTVAFRGYLASLGADDARRTVDGRYVSKKSGSKISTKWIGYGAAGGAVLGTLLGGGLLKGALLGGLGGAVAGYLGRDRGGSFKEVDLAQGAEFGIRVDQRVSFTDSPRYRYASDRNVDDAQPAPRPDPAGVRAGGARGGRGVDASLNGRPLTFNGPQPLTINGELFVPLAPVARAATLRFDQRDEESFHLTTDRGVARCLAGDTQVAIRGERPITLNSAPLSIDGEIYVTTEFLSQVTEMTVNWNRTSRRLTLETLK